MPSPASRSAAASAIGTGRGERDDGDVRAGADGRRLTERDDVVGRGRLALAGEQALVLEEHDRVVAADG